MNWYDQEVRDLRLRNEREQVPFPVVFYGSSSFRMWSSLSTDLNLPNAINAGFGGSTMAACDHFYGRLIPPLKPRSLVLYAGENDLGDGKRPSQVLKSFRSLSAKIARDFSVLPFGFVSIKPSPARSALLDRIRETNSLIRAELSKNFFGFWIDVFEGMLDENGNPRPELFLEDGLHMNAAGYQLWTQKLLPWRERLLGEEGLENQSGVPQVVQSPAEP